uniref:Copia protein n=1 Tax=Tanacetum cinerariifolium TaxID=118510 RepID=A0A6L2JIC8_TANCI|nr:copia protein [Tanacetum cinerariifolium]
MAAVNDVPQLVDKKKDGPFQPKTTDGDAKPESQWTPDERRVVVQDQRLKSIIMTKSTESLSQTYICYKTLLDELVNDCVNLSKHEINVGFMNSLPEKWLTFSHGLRNANHTLTLDLANIYRRFVYEDNLIQRRYSDTKKALITTSLSSVISTTFFSNNVIQDFQEDSDDEVEERSTKEYLRDLDVEYQERALLANSKRFIKRRNNFSGQKANENTECYKCGNKFHSARDCFSKMSIPSYQLPVNNFSSVSKGFQPKFTPKLIQSSSNSSSQTNPKFQKDYKAEYKKMKAKLALLEVSPSIPQKPKTLKPKNKCLVAEIFDWDEEEVSDDEEVTLVKVLMALADDELTVGKSHARNGKWVDITIRKVNTLLSINEDADWQNYLKYINIDIKFVEEQQLNLHSKYNKIVFELNKCRDELLNLKEAKLDAVTFQIQNTKLTKLNHALQEQLKEEKKINNKWLTKENSEAEFLTLLPLLKNLQGASSSSEMLVDEKVNSNQETQESTSKIQKTESSKSVDSSRMSQDSKPKVQNTSSSKSLRPKPIQKPQLKYEPCHYTNHSTDDCYRIFYCMICKREDHKISDNEMYIASFKRSESYKAQPYQYASTSKQILKAKAKPFPPCTHYGFNDHRPDDYRNYPECEIYGSYDHSTLGYNQNRIPKVIVSNAHDVPLTEDIEDHPDLINTKETHEQNVQDDQMITRSTDVPSGNSTEVSRPITEPLVPDVTLSQISNQASTSFYPAPQYRWSKDQNIKLVNIISNLGEGMLTRSMAAKLTAASAKLNQFYRNKVWTLVPLPYGKIAIGSKWVFRNKKDEHGTTTKYKARLVAKGYSQEERIDYDETFAPVARMVTIFLTFATYMNFKVYQMDVKSALLNDFDLKEYSDSNYAGYNMDRKITLAEAEYVVVVGCYASILWMKSQLNDYDIHYKMVPIFCDNTSDIAISNNPNFLREFWSTVVAFDPFPLTDEPEKRPLKEFLIKFSVLNGQRPLTLDFNTFCSSTGLNYNNGKCVNHPTPEAVKKELGKIAINPREIIYSDLVTKLLNKSRLKYVSYPRFISCALQVLLGPDYTQDKKFRFSPPIMSNFNFTKDPSKVTEIELMAHMIAANNQKDLVSPPPLVAKPNKGKSQSVTTTSPKSQGPEASGALSKKSKRPMSKKPPIETKVTPPKPTKGSEQSYSVSSGTVPNLQDLERDTQLTSTRLPSTLDEGTRKSQPLPENATKTTPRPEGSRGNKDSGGNKPPADMEPQNPTDVDLSETGATEDQTQSSRLRYQSLTRNEGEPLYEGELDTQPMLLTYADVRAIIVSEDEAQESEEDILGAGEETDDKSSHPTLILQVKILRKYDDTLPLTERQLVKYLRKVSRVLFERITEDQWEKHEEATVHYVNLKASIDDYYNENIAHIDQTDQLLLKDITNSIKDDPATNKKIVEASETLAKISTQTTKILSSLEESNQLIDANIFIGSSTHLPSVTQAQTITIIHPELSVPQREGKGIATNDQENSLPHLTRNSRVLDKEEEIKKAEEEARLNAISKTEVRKSLELRKHKYDSYMWTVSSRLKPEPITDIKIHPKTKPVVITIYRGTDGRNFDVHKHFLFEAFGISKLDEMREIILNKKNTMVKDLMNSLSQRKQKHMELEPETRIPGLECNQTLLENVPFINNMVIKEPEYGIFFTEEFATSMVKSPENTRFSMKLRKLIAEHLNQEKLKSKKVKLEALGYNMD